MNLPEPQGTVEFISRLRDTDGAGVATSANLSRHRPENPPCRR